MRVYNKPNMYVPKVQLLNIIIMASLLILSKGVYIPWKFAALPNKGTDFSPPKSNQTRIPYAFEIYLSSRSWSAKIKACFKALLLSINSAKPNSHEIIVDGSYMIRLPLVLGAWLIYYYVTANQGWFGPIFGKERGGLIFLRLFRSIRWFL